MADHSAESIGTTLVRFRLVRRYPHAAPLVIGGLLVSGIGALDWVTGPAVSVSLLHGLAVMTVTWLGSRRHGLIVSALAAIEGLALDAVISGFGFSGVWNAAANFGVLAVMVTLVAALQRTLIEHRRHAMVDSLTGALNRRSFQMIADRERLRAGRNGNAVTLAYFDLDDFKEVNDRLGHAGGDRLLRLFASAVRTGVRATDVLCRIGGDEFVLLLPDTDAREAVIVVDRARQILEECCAAEEIPVTVSVGIATYRFPPATVDAMIAGADQLMYQAKGRGGDSVVGTVIVGRWNRWSDHIAETEHALEWV